LKNIRTEEIKINLCSENRSDPIGCIFVYEAPKTEEDQRRCIESLKTTCISANPKAFGELGIRWGLLLGPKLFPSNANTNLKSISDQTVTLFKLEKALIQRHNLKLASQVRLIPKLLKSEFHWIDMMKHRS